MIRLLNTRPSRQVLPILLLTVCASCSRQSPVVSTIAPTPAANLAPIEEFDLRGPEGPLRVKMRMEDGSVKEFALSDLKGQIALSVAIEDKKIAVTVENTSDRPARIWHEGCSWGYEAFNIAIRNPTTGITYHVKKEPICFTVNVPAHYTLAPNERKKFEFNVWNEEEWNRPFQLKSLLDVPLMLQARLAVEWTPEAQKLDVLVGKVESDWIESRPPHAWY